MTPRVWLLGLLGAGLAFVAVIAIRRASFLFPNRITSAFDDTEGAARFARGRAIAALAREIEALGFTSLGVRVERCLLARTRDVSLASREHPCFAAVHRDWNKVHFYFVTAFTDGTVLLTTSRAIRRTSSSYRAASSPAAALAAHLDGVRATKAPPLFSSDRASRLATSRAFYSQPSVRQHMRLTGVLALVNLAMVALAAAFIATR